VVFRHQQNASMNRAGEVEHGKKLEGFYAYRNAFNENSVWVEVPNTGTYVWRRPVCRLRLIRDQVTFHNITDPYNMEPTPEPESPTTAASPVVLQTVTTENGYAHADYNGAAGLEALSAAATSSLPYIRPIPVPEHPSSHSSNNINFILNPTSSDSAMSR
jgi:hypothetical protein